MTKQEVSNAAMRKVTFDTSLPRGACATFTHEGELWFAYPQEKITAVAAVLDRTIGCLDRVHDDLVRWINERPEDAAKIVAIMARTIRAKELARDKARAWTQK